MMTPLKRRGMIAAIILVTFFLTAASPAFWKVRVTVRNNTESRVYIRLQAEKAYYYLTVKPGQKNFTIKTAVYKATFWGCDTSKTIKKLNINRQLRMTFPVCKSDEFNSEKNVLRIIFTKK